MSSLLTIDILLSLISSRKYRFIQTVEQKVLHFKKKTTPRWYCVKLTEIKATDLQSDQDDLTVTVNCKVKQWIKGNNWKA